MPLEWFRDTEPPFAWCAKGWKIVYKQQTALFEVYLAGRLYTARCPSLRYAMDFCQFKQDRIESKPLPMRWEFSHSAGGLLWTSGRHQIWLGEVGKFVVLNAEDDLDFFFESLEAAQFYCQQPQPETFT